MIGFLTLDGEKDTPGGLSNFKRMIYILNHRTSHDITSHDILTDLYSSNRLSPPDIDYLLWHISREVDEQDGDSRRWTQHVSTIVKIPKTPDSEEYSDDLWRIDWDRGLTEYQENEYYEQPYRVVACPKTIEVIEYKPITEDKVGI